MWRFYSLFSVYSFWANFLFPLLYGFLTRKIISIIPPTLYERPVLNIWQRDSFLIHPCYPPSLLPSFVKWELGYLHTKLFFRRKVYTSVIVFVNCKLVHTFYELLLFRLLKQNVQFLKTKIYWLFRMCQAL